MEGLGDVLDLLVDVVEGRVVDDRGADEHLAVLATGEVQRSGSRQASIGLVLQRGKVRMHVTHLISRLLGDLDDLALRGLGELIEVSFGELSQTLGRRTRRPSCRC